VAGFPRLEGTPLAGGNGAKNIRLGIEGSLRRLGTSYIDLYWVHVWDRTTPADEVLETLTAAVRRGEILHYGFSNTPSWIVARVHALAEAHALPRPIGLQYSYSLVDRGVELDVLPMGRELGLGLTPWSPLAAGLLTGKYGREMLAKAGPAGSLPNRAGEEASSSDGRLSGDNPFGGMLFTDRNFQVVDALRTVAKETGRSMAEIALSWVAGRPGVSSVLVGASRPEQLHQNIRALDIELHAGQRERLETASALPTIGPYYIFDLPRERIFCGCRVEPWRG